MLNDNKILILSVFFLLSSMLFMYLRTEERIYDINLTGGFGGGTGVFDNGSSDSPEANIPAPTGDNAARMNKYTIAAIHYRRAVQHFDNITGGFKQYDEAKALTEEAEMKIRNLNPAFAK